ncbi:hypothetical protein O181_032266 [Austropuccinia psidii MF-1]|uniref:Integrase catalytic domain-containing protein n=1 Tax=Austropuccinia psidii MF-1 TaxID=1389203 RepID=A0A9Q3H5Z7_9BASI|nr:hypothetical protein [Austropuccinia psidii MF-1]
MAQALYTNADQRSSSGQLVVDCGAAHHMFHSESAFTSLSKETTLTITTRDSSSNLIAEGMGTVNILSNSQILKLPNSLFVPKLNCNLFSLLKIFDKELIINQDDNSFTLTAEGKEILQGKTENNLMKVDYHLPTSNNTISKESPWHEKLGHAGKLMIKSMGLPPSDDSCRICNLNKIHRLPFKDHFEPAELPLDSVHVDLVGPISPPSISGFWYFLTIVDQATSYKIIWLLKNKSDAFSNFTIIKKMMETQQDRSLKRLMSDQGGEFLNSHFKQLANECGFVHSFSPAYTPEHNGFAKRANQTILEKAKCMLNSSKLPNTYWAEVHGDASPLNVAWDSIEGQEVVDESHLPLECSLELENQEPVDEVRISSVQGTTPASELELVDEVLPADEIAPLSPIGDQVRLPIHTKVIVPHHPTLICSDINQQNILPYSRRAGALLSAADETPQTFKAAISCNAKEVWVDAINRELLSIEKLKVWDLINLDPSYKLVGLTWVFKTKKNHLNQVIEHKAQLCAQGLTQTAGVDLDKTYSPTGRLNSLWTLIAFAASNDLSFHQIDVGSAFINSPLSKMVYLSLP